MKMKHLISAVALVGLCSCSGFHRYNEFAPSRPDLTQEEHDAEYNAYLESNRAWDSVAPMLLGVFAIAAMMNQNGGGFAAPITPTTPTTPPPPP